jgi:hypothetical protein
MGAVTLTSSDVGLSAVNNTSDASKPVSTLQAAADSAVQAYAIQRAYHTGSQLASTISDFATEAAKFGPVTSVNGMTGAVTVSGGSGSSVLEYNTTSDVPSTGNAGLLYVATDTSRIYHWASTTYVQLG